MRSRIACVAPSAPLWRRTAIIGLDVVTMRGDGERVDRFWQIHAGNIRVRTPTSPVVDGATRGEAPRPDRAARRGRPATSEQDTGERARREGERWRMQASTRGSPAIRSDGDRDRHAAVDRLPRQCGRRHRLDEELPQDRAARRARGFRTPISRPLGHRIIMMAMTPTPPTSSPTDDSAIPPRRTFEQLVVRRERHPRHDVERRAPSGLRPRRPRRYAVTSSTTSSAPTPLGLKMRLFPPTQMRRWRRPVSTE